MIFHNQAYARHRTSWITLQRRRCSNIASSPRWARVEDQQLLFSHWTKVPLAEPAETTTVAADHDSCISENLCAPCKIPPNYRHNSVCYGAHKSLCDQRCGDRQRLPA